VPARHSRQERSRRFSFSMSVVRFT
jgi:hypothetical protein